MSVTSVEPKTPDESDDPFTLSDTTTDSLSKTFRALSQRAADALKPYRGTLAKLNEFVTKFQSIGVDQVGIELATYDKLRTHQLMTRPGSSDASLYAILTIYDAKFLIRVQEDNKIVTYTENINKPAPGIQYLDSDEFWYRSERSSGGTLKILRNEPKFNEYNLGDEADVLNLMTAIAETTAALAAKEELRSYDAPAAQDGKGMQKSFAGLKPRH